MGLGIARIPLAEDRVADQRLTGSRPRLAIHLTARRQSASLSRVPSRPSTRPSEVIVIDHQDLVPRDHRDSSHDSLS
jgi:hypothetical protein